MLSICSLLYDRTYILYLLWLESLDLMQAGSLVLTVFQCLLLDEQHLFIYLFIFSLQLNERQEGIQVSHPIEPVSTYIQRNTHHAKTAVHIQYSLYGHQPMFVHKLACSEGRKCGVQALCPRDLKICMQCGHSRALGMSHSSLE